MSAAYQRIKRNTLGRDIIVGDVHGHFTKLRAALDSIRFDDKAGDRLFFVGDLVDRGPESEMACDWLGLDYTYAVRGNHDQWAIDHAYGRCDREIYLANGGAWSIGLTPAEQREIASTFEALPIAIELETASGLVGIVHAECPFSAFAEIEPELEAPGMRATTVADTILWSRCRIGQRLENPVNDVRAVVVGHTPVKAITTVGNHIYIDTGAWRGGEFTLLNAATLQPERAVV